MAELSNEEALTKFLLDIQCLDELSKWSERFNLFDTLNLTDVENRHSDMLAWLLDPNGNHGLGDSLLRKLIQELAAQSQLSQKEIFDTLLMDLGSFEIFREYSEQKKRMDILAVSRKEEFLICIENKVRSKEHDNQLFNYRRLLEEDCDYRDYRKLFVFLTPDGSSPIDESDKTVWQVLDYRKIIEMLKEIIKGENIIPDVKTVIQHYIDTVRRHIVGDEDLELICKKIYMKHKNALDLIFEYRSNSIKRAADEIKKWCRAKANANKIVFNETAMNSKLCEISFTTPFMSKVLPGFDEEKSGWNDKNMYHYAIFNKSDGGKFSVRLIVAGKNLSERQRQCCRKLYDHISTAKPREEGWQWWTLKTLESFSVESELAEDEYQAAIFAGLDGALSKIEALEKKLDKMDILMMK